jgi:hypothetical protein
MSLRASRIMLLYQLLKIIIKARPNCESIIARLGYWNRQNPIQNSTTITYLLYLSTSCFHFSLIILYYQCYQCYINSLKVMLYQ